jgi:hypothetical protein
VIKAEVLTKPPISGSVDEVHFSAVGDCTWVRFTDAVDTQWCGVFGPGCAGRRAAVVNPTGSAFVVSWGQGYLIDVNTRELLHKTDCEWLISAIAVPGRDVIVACTFTELVAYSPLGRVWNSARVSIDGIELAEASRATVKGRVWNLERWVDFNLDIESWTYRSEFVCTWD